MEIKKGYKMTDVGVIPEDWEVKKIEPDLGRVKSGKRLPLGYFVIPNKNNHPYIRVIDMNMGYIDTSSIMYVPEEAYNYIEQYIITKDDIYISVAGTLGLIGKIPEYLDGANLTENANRITEIKCDRDYLMYWLMSGYIQDCIKDSQTLGAQPKLAVYQIRDFLVALPQSVGEQQAIADALTKVDNLIMSLSKVIEKKKLIKKGAMQKLLSGEMRLDGYNNIIKSVNLSDIGEIKAGGTPSTNVPSYWGGTINWLQSGAVKNRVLDIRDVEKTITYDGLASSSAYLIKENSVLIAITGATCGNIAYLPFKSAANQSVVAIQVNVGFNSKYIFYMLIQNSDKIVNNRGGSAQGGVAVNILKEIELCIHEDIDEQTAIADILTTMDNEIEALEKERDKYKCIKQGMMQQLLTGKIRLICQ